jgi:hypothetical protein
LSSGDRGLTAREESFQGWIAEHIPVLRNFQVAFRVFQNHMRFEWWRWLQRHSHGSLEEAKYNANAVNVFTGRGGGWLGKVSSNFTDVFNSPRYQISRLQYLLLQPLLTRTGGYRNTKKARAIIATEYAKQVATSAAWMFMVKTMMEWLGDDEDDPKVSVETNLTSSDLWKIKVGNVRIDVFAGLQQFVVFGARAWTNMTTSLEGKEREMKADDKDLMIWRFLRNRFAPIPGAAVSKFVGQTPDFERATTGKVLLDLVKPVSAAEGLRAAKSAGETRGAVLAGLSLLGESVSVIPPYEVRKQLREIDSSLDRLEGKKNQTAEIKAAIERLKKRRSRLMQEPSK